ncbi:MAG: hypothetical protein WB562_14570 [Candidatus Sulfotelmatobacter sp.]
MLATPHARLLSVIYGLMAAVSIIAMDLRIALVPAAFVSLALFIGGLSIFRRWSGAFSIPWPVADEDSTNSPSVVILGTPCPLQGYEQELVVHLRTRRLAELLACALLAAASLFVVFTVPISWQALFGPAWTLYAAEFACGVGWIILLANLRWLNERLFLRRSWKVIGTIIGMDPDFFRRGITYQFFDHRQERRGGRGPLRHRGDNAVLVFYDPRDPDKRSGRDVFLSPICRASDTKAWPWCAGALAWELKAEMPTVGHLA